MMDRPITSVGVMIFKDGKVLLGKRLAGVGTGDYAFTGGKLEHSESIEECARRETLEEAGIEIKNVKFHFITNLNTHYKPFHFVHIGLTAKWAKGEPRAMEPEKCAQWDWYSIENLPDPIMFATKLSFDKKLRGEGCRDF